MHSKPQAIGIGKDLMLSPPFPLLHTVRASFPAYGVPSIVSTYFNQTVSNKFTKHINFG